MEVRLSGRNLELISSIKAGKVPAAKVLSMVESLEAQCHTALERHPWGPSDPRPVERLLIRVRRGEM